MPGDTTAVPDTLTVLPATVTASRRTLARSGDRFDRWTDPAAARAWTGSDNASAAACTAAIAAPHATNARTPPRRLIPLLFKPVSLSRSPIPLSNNAPSHYYIKPIKLVENDLTAAVCAPRPGSRASASCGRLSRNRR